MKIKRSIDRLRAGIASRIHPMPFREINPADVRLLVRGATDAEFVEAVRAWAPQMSEEQLIGWVNARRRANGTDDSRPPER